MSWQIGFLDDARWWFDALEDADWRIADDLIVGYATNATAGGPHQAVRLERDGVIVHVAQKDASRTIVVLSVEVDEGRASQRTNGLLDRPSKPRDP